MESKQHEYNDVINSNNSNNVNNYSLSNTNRFLLIKDILYFLMEITGEKISSIYDVCTLDAPQGVKRNIDKTISSEGSIGKIIEMISNLIKQQSYLFKSTSSNNINNYDNNDKFEQQQQQYISSLSTSTESSPNTSSVYSTPNSSSFVSSPLNNSQVAATTSTNTPQSFQISSDSVLTNLTPEQLKIKTLELELLKIREATALLMMNKSNAAHASHAAVSPVKPKQSAPPPPPPPPIFKQNSFTLKKSGSLNDTTATTTPTTTNNHNCSTGMTQPASFNIQDVLAKRNLLKKVGGQNRSPGGTPAKEPKKGADDMLKSLQHSIVHKFKNANHSPMKFQNDDDSSDSDFE